MQVPHKVPIKKDNRISIEGCKKLNISVEMIKHRTIAKNDRIKIKLVFFIELLLSYQRKRKMNFFFAILSEPCATSFSKSRNTGIRN